MLNWKNLVVTGYGEETTLDEMVTEDDAGLNHALICDGRITAWFGYFISAPGEVPDWDTPKVEVDWEGFEEALNENRR